MIIRLTLPERLLRRAHLLPLPVMDAFGGVLFGRVLAIAVRRGLFEALAEGPRGCDALARETGLHAEAAALVADASVEAGYLVKRGGGYALSPEGRKWLLKDSPHSLVFLIRYFETLHERWRNVEAAMVDGKPAKVYYEGFSTEDWRVYALAMRDLARLVLPVVMPNIRLRSDASLLVDVGGSHGLYAIESCRRHPGLNAVVMDFGPALQVAGEFVRGAAMEKRIRLLEGDILHTPIPSPADCVLLFNVIHGLTGEQNRDLIARALGALRPGGKLFILDQLKSERGGSGLGRFVPLMVGLNLLSESGGTAYHPDQVREWCASASSQRRHRLRLPGLTLVVAVR